MRTLIKPSAIDSLIEPVIRPCVNSITQILAGKGYSVKGVDSYFVEDESKAYSNYSRNSLSLIRLGSIVKEDLKRILEFPELIPYDFKRKHTVSSNLALLLGKDPFTARSIALAMEIER